MIRVLAVIAVVGALLAAWLFPRSFPIVALSNRATRETVLQRADSFATAHNLPRGQRTAVMFTRDDSLHTFIDLVGGGKDTLEALVRGRDAAPYQWSVRSFTPTDVHETRVRMAADGRIIGFERRLAEADARPQLDSAAGRRLADSVLTVWLGEQPDRWRLAASSYETKKASARVDRTFTYERTTRRIAGAPIRLAIVIAGDLPTRASHSVEVPESFERRYGEMRSSNDAFSLASLVGMFVIAIVGAFALRHFVRDGRVRWKPALAVGGVIAALFVAAGVNELPSAWYGYDTAAPPTTYLATLILGGISGAVAVGVLATLSLAAGEAAARTAFPRHLDWYGLWKNRGTREVGQSVAAGYALAATGIAYVSAFYLVTGKLLGWWVPAELLDDPNQIATPLPWVAGVAASLQAGVWEEVFFRALPLSLLSLWVGSRPRRNVWMGAGVVLTALIFGFGHASYPSWPAYSRGVEIFLEACLWGVLFVRFGILMTVLAHFFFDLSLFGLFTAAGVTLPYLLSAAVTAAVLFAPALVVLAARIRHRTLAPAAADALAGGWSPPPKAVAEVVVPRVSRALSERARMAAFGAAAVAAVVALAAPTGDVLGPRFVASQSRAGSVADSMVSARGVDPKQWRRLITVGNDTLAAWPRFVKKNKAPHWAQDLARTYAIPLWWVVRYVHTTGTAGERTEEWRARIAPDGAPVDLRHIVADSAAGATLTPGEARKIARASLAATRLDTLALQEVNLEETARPARRDVKVTYTDTTVKLPANGAARAWVTIAGSEVLVVRRGVELPEDFLRSDRASALTKALIAATGALAVFTFVVVGAIVVLRRRAPVVNDLTVPLRTRWFIVVGVFAMASARSLAGFNDSLASYDTAQPWSTFVTMNAVQSGIGAVFLAFVIPSMWLAVDALRRRVGLPVWTPLAQGAKWSDALVAGLGLGGLSAALSQLSVFAPREIPQLPTAPSLWLTTVLAVPMGVISTLPIIAIPLLVILGLARRMALRIVLGAALGAAIVAVIVTAADRTSPVAATIGALSMALILAGMFVWARVGAAAWVVAALAAEFFPQLRRVFHSTTAGGATASALGSVVAVGLVYLVERAVRSAPASAPVPEVAPPPESHQG